MSGYTYGGTKSTPTISGNTSGGTVTYYYNTTDSNSGGTAWSNVASSSSLAVGTYYIYATVATTTNYNAATTQPVAFTISGITRTATFYSNGNTLSTPSGCTASGTNRVCSCTTTGTSTSCSVTAPTITAPTNTPTIIGFSTGATNRTKSVASGASVSLSSNPSYYAQTTKAEVTYTATFNAGTGVSKLSSTSQSCSIAATYNGTTQGTQCSITAANIPTVTASEGYTTSSCPSGYTCSTVPGWYNSSGTRVLNISGSALTLSASGTYTAKARIAVASELEYDNSTSGLLDSSGNNCTDAQCAIDSINRILGWIILK